MYGRRQGMEMCRDEHTTTSGTSLGFGWEFDEIVKYEARRYQVLDRARVEPGEFKLIDEESESGAPSGPDRNHDANDR